MFGNASVELCLDFVAEEVIHPMVGGRLDKRGGAEQPAVDHWCRHWGTLWVNTGGRDTADINITFHITDTVVPLIKNTL